MMTIFKHGTNIDFIGKAPFWLKVTLVSFVLALVAIFRPGGLKLGLDFSGGYEVLLSFEKPVTAEQVRTGLAGLDLGDTSVQHFDVKESPRQHFLVRVQRATNIDTEELAQLNKAFSDRYASALKGVHFNPDIGNTIEVEFADTGTASAAAVDTSSAAITAVVQSTGHDVRRIRPAGKADQKRFAVVLAGIDTKVVEQMRSTLDPTTKAERVEFVGPTVGRQLRDDGILAMFYALLLILIYVALRFDFFYGPGAIACVFHDAIITTGLLALVGRDFNLTTIAGLLTLIGYSMNDTIIVYDRIRETVGKAHGAALKDVLNKAVNDTLNRTIMTSLTVFVCALVLMIFGVNTVLFDYGFIMAFGVVIGTYSSIYVAAPIFMYLRLRFGPRDGPKEQVGKGARTRVAAPTS